MYTTPSTTLLNYNGVILDFFCFHIKHTWKNSSYRLKVEKCRYSCVWGHSLMTGIISILLNWQFCNGYLNFKFKLEQIHSDLPSKGKFLVFDPLCFETFELEKFEKVFISSSIFNVAFLDSLLNFIT